MLGSNVCPLLGINVLVGSKLGLSDGIEEGMLDGSKLGVSDDISVGLLDGIAEGVVGVIEGSCEGKRSVQ